ncbi:MAG: tRNA preQ1(34) S-adenosylmethionine ribosyltransferase-isomerase QueA [Candidatus Omnitrophica bacterium]|nr:tRNA preQ1(34) S-adenosylmethionine ribosyltransferase-isomerase QueA [Candidatus Omnitrophota bacterium]
MKYSLADFDYTLPKELIAAYPLQDRTRARLLRIDRRTGNFSHHIFRDLVSMFVPGDLLVLNNTKVLPARIFGKKTTGGKVEVFLLKEQEPGVWTALLRPGRGMKKGARLFLGENGTSLETEVLDDAKPGSCVRLFRFDDGSLKEKVRKIGHIPLPPYIHRPDTSLDREFYQTVFAEKEGAVASPTAGLHFDRAMLAEIQKREVEICYITLHVSYGTFRPLTHADLSKGEIFEESYEITENAARQLNKALEEKRRIIACGTTSVRACESAAVKENDSVKVTAGRGVTRLFIFPPYEFKVVQCLITNFHLPKSSLLFLVAAFLGREKLFKGYEEAIRERYRFYSYGDAMVIL